MSLPTLISSTDLSAFAIIDPVKAAAMIEDATAQAIITAPCLTGTLTEVQALAVKGILRAAILRWNDAGSGAKVTQQTAAGPFSSSETFDTSNQRRGVFWPSEITALQRICKSVPSPYGVDMGGASAAHLAWCDVMFGGIVCTCGVDIAGEPIYEMGDE